MTEFQLYHVCDLELATLYFLESVSSSVKWRYNPYLTGLLGGIKVASFFKELNSISDTQVISEFSPLKIFPINPKSYKDYRNSKPSKELERIFQTMAGNWVGSMMKVLEWQRNGWVNRCGEPYTPIEEIQQSPWHKVGGKCQSIIHANSISLVQFYSGLSKPLVSGPVHAIGGLDPQGA